MNGALSVVHVNDAPELMARDPIGLLVQLSTEGDIVLIDSGSSLKPTTYVFSHPDAVREILVTKHASFRKGGGMKALEQVLGEDLITSEGAAHRTRRRVVQPVFHRARIAPFGDIIVAKAAEARERWRPPETIDIGQQMTQLTLRIATEILVGSDIQPQEASALAVAVAAVEDEFTSYGLPFSDVLEPTAVVDRLAAARTLVDQVLYPMIERRVADATEDSDFISMMLNLHDADLPHGLSIGQIRNEAIALLLAGHVTTATTLTWAWHLLASNPAARLQVEAEVDRLLALSALTTLTPRDGLPMTLIERDANGGRLAGG